MNIKEFVTVNKEYAKSINLDTSDETELMTFLYHLGLRYFYDKKSNKLKEKFDNMTFPMLLYRYQTYFRSNEGVSVISDEEDLKNPMLIEINISQDEQNKFNKVYDDDMCNTEDKFNEFRVIFDISKEKENKATEFTERNNLRLIISFNPYLQTCRFDYIHEQKKWAKSFIINYIDTYEYSDTIVEKIKDQESIIKEFTEDEYTLRDIIMLSLDEMLHEQYSDMIDYIL